MFVFRATTMPYCSTPWLWAPNFPLRLNLLLYSLTQSRRLEGNMIGLFSKGACIPCKMTFPNLSEIIQFHECLKRMLFFPTAFGRFSGDMISCLSQTYSKWTAWRRIKVVPNLSALRQLWGRVAKVRLVHHQVWPLDVQYGLVFRDGCQVLIADDLVVHLSLGGRNAKERKRERERLRAMTQTDIREVAERMGKPKNW